MKNVYAHIEEQFDDLKEKLLLDESDSASIFRFEENVLLICARADEQFVDLKEKPLLDDSDSASIFPL